MAADRVIPYLSEEQLSDLDISTYDVIESIETLISKLDNKTAWSAPKAVLLPDDGRYMMAALAAADEPPLLAVKTVVQNPRNPGKGLPHINGLVTMLDSNSGLPVAILDGNWITAIRTAGLSATAAKYMARKDSSIAAFVGCGVQAKSHLHAFSDLFPLQEVRIFGRAQASLDSFCQNAADLSLSPVVCATAQEAVAAADLVITTVPYPANLPPLLDAGWLKPGCFAAIVDLATPWNKASFSAFDHIAIDDLDQEAALPSKLAPSEFVTGDLSGLVLGKFKGRCRDMDRTAFIFRGHAMGDLALSGLACQRAIKSGIL